MGRGPDWPNDLAQAHQSVFPDPATMADLVYLRWNSRMGIYTGTLRMAPEESRQTNTYAC